MFSAYSTILWAFRFEWPIYEHGLELKCGVDELVDNELSAHPRPLVLKDTEAEGARDRV
ncbi:hypothetical protein CALVIDRAFT_534178 [Calocera viscosa TUFC12733]|uniref:Uncharacterized protein n=1 Tax=Calocera viscosa (strain TUFC12733) TaxID=1330018 RepID=A0A167QH72_CALVF|nr:hypothetical protein CALVIDRAFT_534178 [Calocera viscosa TUFC12733]